MVAINVTDLVNDIKEALDLRSETSDTFVKKMLRFAVIEISKKFSTLFHQEETYDSDSNGIITLPADTFRILSVLADDREASPLSLRKYNIYRVRGLSYSTELFASVKQYTDRIELKLLPQGSYSDVTVITQNFNNGAGNIGIEHEEVLLKGACVKYLEHKKRTTDVSIQAFMKAGYQEMLDNLTWEQNNMYPEERMQFYWENTWEKNFSFNLVDETRDNR